MKANIFVIMPFDDDFDSVFEYLIKGPLIDCGYHVKRADDISSENQGNILKNIIQQIIDSDVIIADLSTLNANVCYELGIAHSINRKVVMIIRDISELPFDLKSYRIITYSRDYQDMENAKAELIDLINECVEKDIKIGNPVSDFGNLIKSNDVNKEDSNQINDTETNQNGDLGLLDYKVEMQDGFKIMTDIMGELRNNVLDPLVTEMEIATSRITGPEKDSPKRQRTTMRSLSLKFNGFIDWIKENQDTYKNALSSAGRGLDYLLTNSSIENNDDKTSMIELINTIDVSYDAVKDCLSQFDSMIEVMDNIPKIEKNFDRSNKMLSEELKAFMKDYSQTLSMMERTKEMAQNLLSKEE